MESKRITISQSNCAGQNKCSNNLKIAHLNARSLKNFIRFHELKEMVSQKNFDILTISENWFNSSVSNASVALDGHTLYRLDRLLKADVEYVHTLETTSKLRP